jgi:hypothetical protein
MFGRNMNPMARAQARLAVPRGAQRGAVAGQGQMARMPAPRQAGNPMLAAVPQLMQQTRGGRGITPTGFGRVPQGADAGAIAGCGDGSCLDINYAAPWLGFPGEPMPFVQDAALIAVQVQPDDNEPITVQVSCGNSLFYGCCARSFNGPGEVNILSIFSGSSDVDLLCPGSGGLDINFFNTNGNECCCPFDFGCFSSFFPLILEFDPIGTPSTPPFINMVIGGSRLQGGNACAFWPGLFPGVPPMAPPSGAPVG